MYKAFLLSLFLLLNTKIGAQGQQEGFIAGIDGVFPVLSGNTWVMPTTNINFVLNGKALTTDSRRWIVFSYSFRLKGDRKEEIGPYYVSGPYLTREIKEAIREYAGYSGTMYFEDIKSACRDCRLHGARPIIMKYK